MITLYEFAASGNCHKVRLLLSLLDLPYERVLVRGREREHQSPAFLARNPFGQVPVLVDGSVVLRDSQAILLYLALTYGNGRWLPASAAGQAQVAAWLSTAANEVAHGPALLRAHYRFGRPIDLASAEAGTTRLLAILEAHLAAHDWLVGDSPSIADLAIYPYLALAPDARIDLTPYPAVRRWLAAVRGQPGYVGMPGMYDHA
jgi:glutathione S-transferase